MPGTARSLLVTEAYRERLTRLLRATESEAVAGWREVDFNALKASYEPVKSRLGEVIRRAQREAAQVSLAYLAAFLSAELGRTQPARFLDTNPYVGKSFGGADLATSLDGPIISTLSAIKRKDPDPMGQGLRALKVNVDLDIQTAARSSLADLMAADELVVGQRRAVRGTCAACLSAAEEATAPPGTPLNIHPSCGCVAEPVVRGVPDRFPRPSGSMIFAALTPQQQDEAVGRGAAERIRSGAASLNDFVMTQAPGDSPGFLVQRPTNDLPKT